MSIQPGICDCKNPKLDTGRYTPECLTEREQAKHGSTLVITENKATLLFQKQNQGISCARKRT